MKQIANDFIMIFSGALAFIAGLLFITDSQAVNPSFQLTMDVLQVPALFAFTTVVVLAKMKQKKEGLAL